MPQKGLYPIIFIKMRITTTVLKLCQLEDLFPRDKIETLLKLGQSEEVSHKNRIEIIKSDMNSFLELRFVFNIFVNDRIFLTI